MIEISNDELAKVLNLWTGTEEWEVTDGELFCDGWVQRWYDNEIISPTPVTKDEEAHALVNFMLKERKYPDGSSVFYTSGIVTPDKYVEWVKNWEIRFKDKPQATEQVIDHSIPVRYDHIISTEELVKRAKERWPDDGWCEEMGEPVVGNWGFGEGEDEGIIRPDDDKGKTDYNGLRAKLLTLINEVRSERTTPEMLDELEECRKELCKPSSTKAERFYAFLATPQPDISPGLWGLEREPEAPVRGGDGGWAREDVGALSDCPIAQSEYMTVTDIPQDTVDV